MSAFEKFRFVDDISIKDLQAALKKCDPSITQSGVFDDPTRNGISAATEKAGLPKTKSLSEESYKMVCAVCI